jgi:hypothetical protein
VRHSQKKEIDGIVWTVNEFTATEGLRLLTKLTKQLGGPVAKAIEALPKGGGSILDAQLDFSLLGSALTDLTGRLDEDEVVNLITRLLACTLADGKPVNFDLTFQGRYLTLFKVVGFVLEVNFKVPLADWLAAASTAALAGAEENPQGVAAAGAA